jgi:hypothetical protein
MAVLGPWAQKPSLDANQFNVYQQGGKWFATRKAPAAAPQAPPPAPEAAPAAPPKPPTFAANYTDAQGKTDLANLDEDRLNTQNDALKTRDQAMASINAQQPGIERNTTLGLHRNASEAAARGMFRSGNRVVQQGRTRTEGPEQLSGLERGRNEVTFGYDRTLRDSNVAHTRGTQGVYTDSGRRGLEKWRMENGI